MMRNPMLALSRTLLLALVLTLLLHPGRALAAPTDAQLDTLMRYYADLASEPLTPAEAATIRQATIELFDKHATTATDRLARATRALKDPITNREIADSLRSMAIASIGLDGMSEPGGPDARVYAILDAHYEHAKSAPPPPVPAPAPARAPALPPAAPQFAPVPAQTPPRPDPPEALTDNFLIAAALLANRALTPAEMADIRSYLAIADSGNFHDSLVKFAQTPPDWAAIAKSRATWAQQTLPKLLVFELAVVPGGGLDPLRAGSSYQLLNPMFNDLAKGGLTATQVGYTVHYAETLVGGPLLPDEVAVLRAAAEAHFRKFNGYSLQSRFRDGYTADYLATLPPADRDKARADDLKTRREHVAKDTSRKSQPTDYAIDQAILAAYERLNPGK